MSQPYREPSTVQVGDEIEFLPLEPPPEDDVTGHFAGGRGTVSAIREDGWLEMGRNDAINPSAWNVRVVRQP